MLPEEEEVAVVGVVALETWANVLDKRAEGEFQPVHQSLRSCPTGVVVGAASS
uniref:Uncharacterized protein n=1 Tax=Lepeophtheirus salmonis TaxID=72036 RepID=A0A0K2TC85_LEPSM